MLICNIIGYNFSKIYFCNAFSINSFIFSQLTVKSVTLFFVIQYCVFLRIKMPVLVFRGLIGEIRGRRLKTAMKKEQATQIIGNVCEIS